MKKIFTLLIGIVFSITVLNAQDAPPQAFSFKATIKDKYGLPVLLKKINLRITILQGDMNGGMVYSEYFTPTTNLYSQVDIEIGRGIVLSGNFSSIDWSANEYFLKIEADVKGGSNYQLLSVTQLLSVPYALYAGSAGSVANLIETDPVFSGSTAHNISLGDINNWNTAVSWGDHHAQGYLKSFTELDPAVTNNFDFTGAVTNDLLKFNGSKWVKFTPDYLTSFAELDPAVTNNFDFTGAVTNDLLKFNGSKWVKFTPNFALTNHTHSDATTSISGFMSGTDKTRLNGLQNADGSETKVTAGTNVTITGVGTAAFPYVINSTVGGSGSSHYIGESYGGGIIFYLDASGQHGLIAATTDQSTAIQWYNGSYTNTTAFASSVGGGDGNTSMIAFNQGAGTYAAKLCYDLYIGGFIDWYLPSKYELNLMYHNIGQGNLLGLGNVGGFSDLYYWSSTESSTNYAWSQYFLNGGQPTSIKYSTCYVRAVRAF